MVKGSKIKVSGIKRLYTKFKGNIRSVIVVLICILLYSWGIVSCLDMWLRCVILDYNSQNVKIDVMNGTFTEVKLILENGDFILEGDSSEQVYNMKDVSEYIRVPNGEKYYYNKESKQLVSQITYLESRNIILQYGILDLVCFFATLVLSMGLKDKRIWKKILFIVFAVARELFSFMGITVAMKVLFHVDDKYFLILVGKALIVSFVFMLRNIIVSIREKKKSSKVLNIKRSR